MTVQIEDSSLEGGAAGRGASAWRLPLSRAACLLTLICVAAFVLRCVYLLSLDHLLCQFGDGYFFLAGASKLRELICTAIQSGHLNLLDALPPASANGMVALGSVSVSDRLMVDGPVFPGYLALVQALVGLPPGSLLFDGKAMQMSLIRALLDSFTCLLIYAGTRPAFGGKAGCIAAFLFAVYPPSIINTQSSYTEPFACFVLALWSWLVLVAFGRHATGPQDQPTCQSIPSAQESSKKTSSAILFAALGAISGILVLTRPPFIFLPIVFALILVLLRLLGGGVPRQLRLRQFAFALPLVAGLFVVLLPWLAFTHKVTGQFSVCVNRVPAFNLFLGNQLQRDGWRAYPFSENIPEQTSVAAKQILDQAVNEPFAFASMELRKIPRLWAGTWNEFQYALFGVPLALQEIFHQVMLSLAALGLLLLLTSRKCRQKYDAAISLFIAVLVVHNLYLAFEPISRYAMTAMPAVFMLASYIIARLGAQPKVLATVVFALTLAALLINLQSPVIAYCAIPGGKVLLCF